METFINFLQAQTVFGLLALISFVLILGLQTRNLIKATSPSLLLGVASLLPLLFSVIAANVHLNAVRKMIESEAVDIVSPAAGIQLAMEIIWVGVGLSVALAAIPIFSTKR